MAQFVRYKFYDHPAMPEFIMQFTVFNSPSNPTSKLNIDLDNIKSLPAQVKLLPYYLTKFKSNHNYR